MKAWILITMLLMGCGSAESKSYVDSAIMPYYKVYIKEKQERLGKEAKYIPVAFKSLKSPTIGVCYNYSSGKRQIYLDPSFWFSGTDSDRESLLFHELGHCDLNLGHENPSSIMEPNILSSFFYNEHRDYLLNELFGLVSLVDLYTTTATKTNTNSIELICGGIKEINDEIDN